MRKRDTWRDARVAAEYDERRFGGPFGRRKQRRDEALVRALLGLGAGTGGSRALDLPCGTGRLEPTLAAAGYRVVGVDVSLPMMRAGRAAGRQRAALIAASAFRLPFAPGAFAAALSARFLFHLDDRAQRVAVLAELRRVTAGAVVGQVRHRGNWKQLGRWLRSRLGLARRYRPSHSRTEIAAELEAAGLELIELRPVSRLFSDKAFFLARPR
jgi:SAM-dependent methyltransferase